MAGGFFTLSFFLQLCIAVAGPAHPFQALLGYETMKKSFQSTNIASQNDTICDAGTLQWTGRLPVSKDREMFFCEVIRVIAHVSVY